MGKIYVLARRNQVAGFPLDTFFTDFVANKVYDNVIIWPLIAEKCK